MLARLRGLLAAVLVAAALLGAAPAGAADIGTISHQQIIKLVSDNRGKIVILNFWATWCGPCRAEIPDLIKLRKDYSPDEVILVGVSMDYEKALVGAFVDKVGINYPVYVATEDVGRVFGIRSIPKLVIYGSGGEMAVNHDGMADFGELRKALDTMRKKK